MVGLESMLKSGIVKPKMAFALLKNELEKQAGEKLTAFKISHIIELEKMAVYIQRESSNQIEKYSYEEKGNMLGKIISHVSNKDIKNGSLKAFEIFFGNNESYLQIFFIDENGGNQIKKIML